MVRIIMKEKLVVKKQIRTFLFLILTLQFTSFFGVVFASSMKHLAAQETNF